MMTSVALWSRCKKFALSSRSIFGKEFLLLKKQDFDFISCQFSAKKNPLNSKINYRSFHSFVHVHVVDYGEVVEVHKDMGNVDRFLPLGLIHLFVDVIPYFAWHVLHFKTPYALACDN